MMEVSCLLRLGRDAGSYFGVIPRDIVCLIADLLREDAVPLTVYFDRGITINGCLHNAHGGTLMFCHRQMPQLYNIAGEIIYPEFDGVLISENHICVRESRIVDIKTGHTVEPIYSSSRSVSKGEYFLWRGGPYYYNEGHIYQGITVGQLVCNRLSPGPFAISSNLANPRVWAKSTKIKGLWVYERRIGGPRGEAVIVVSHKKTIIVRRGRSVTCDRAVEHPRGLITQTDHLIRFMPWKGQSKLLVRLQSYGTIMYAHHGHLLIQYAGNSVSPPRTVIYPLTE